MFIQEKLQMEGSYLQRLTKIDKKNQKKTIQGVAEIKNVFIFALALQK